MKSKHPAYIKGFTLLELLVSMSILVVIVMMMSRIFTDTNRMWSMGTKRIQEAQEARGVMDFLVQGISTAIADDLISFKMHSETGPNNLSVSAYEEDTDSLAFVAYTQTPPWGGGGDDARRRSTSQFIYYVDYMLDQDGDAMDAGHDEGPRYRLVRLRKTRSAHTVSEVPGNTAGIKVSAYNDPEWWLPSKWEDVLRWGESNKETIAMNVIGFELWAYTGQGVYEFNYDSNTLGEPPLWVDVYLEVMGEDNINQLVQMWKMNHPEWEDYLERNVRRYSARVYLRNREGYSI